MKRMTKPPKAIGGKFIHILPNEDIVLSQEKITLLKNGEKIKTRGNLYLELSPLLDFSITTKLSKSKTHSFSIEDINLQVDREVDSSWLVTNINNQYRSNQNSVTLTGKALRAHIKFPTVKNLLYSKFHIFNFPNFVGSPIQYPDGTISASRLELEGGDWRVYIDSIPNTENNIKLLRKSGGYAITHVGKLERLDKKTFTSEDATELATKLMYFLSFANGLWVNPTLFTGFNPKGREVWQGWFVHHSHPWKRISLSWYDSLHATEILPSAFSGFYEITDNPVWSKVINQIIYWFIQTNISNVDSGLILGQTALELLAWNYLVIDKAKLSRNKFKQNNTAENLKILMSELNIPTLIPPAQKKLRAFARSDDGPALITRIRNDLVHPEKEIKGIPYFYVRNLQQWYIELILLRIFDYQGNYFNRTGEDLWAGKVEPVPWL